MKQHPDNRRAIAQVIAHGHSFQSHHNEFDDPRWGREIDITYEGKHDPVALGVYIEQALSAPGARLFTVTNTGTDDLSTSYIYNEDDNVMIVLDANNAGDFGTIYRPNPNCRKFERLHEFAGSPPIKKGEKAIAQAIHRFELDIHKHSPEAWETLTRKASDLQLETIEPELTSAAKEQKRADANDGGLEDKSQAANEQNAENPGSEQNGPPVNPTVLDVLSDKENTMGFWADKDARVTHYFNERNHTVVTLSPNNLCVKRFESSQEAFDYFSKKFDQSAQSLGIQPELVQGGHKALTDQYRAVTGHKPKMCKTMRRIAQQLQHVNLGCVERLSNSIQSTMRQGQDQPGKNHDGGGAYELSM